LRSKQKEERPLADVYSTKQCKTEGASTSGAQEADDETATIANVCLGACSKRIPEPGTIYQEINATELDMILMSCKPE
jgi:hypothetical protein